MHVQPCSKLLEVSRANDHKKGKESWENKDTEWGRERGGEQKTSSKGKGKGKRKGKGKGKGIRDSNPYNSYREAVPYQQAADAKPCSDLQQSLEWQAGPVPAATQWHLHPHSSSKPPFERPSGQGRCLPR